MGQSRATIGLILILLCAFSVSAQSAVDCWFLFDTHKGDNALLIAANANAAVTVWRGTQQVGHKTRSDVIVADAPAVLMDYPVSDGDYEIEVVGSGSTTRHTFTFDETQLMFMAYCSTDY